MAVRSTLSRVPRPFSSVSTMENAAARRGLLRYFSDTTKGKILSEEERAVENVYIQKMERERMEKARQKAEQEKAKLDSGKAKSSSSSDKAKVKRHAEAEAE